MDLRERHRRGEHQLDFGRWVGSQQIPGRGSRVRGGMDVRTRRANLSGTQGTNVVKVYPQEV